MTANSSPRVCLVPALSGVGGMVSFQDKLTSGLVRRGIQVCHDLSDPAVQAVLIIGGTRQLSALWRVRHRGVRVVQRLDGMNWLHRLKQARSGWRHAVRAMYGNLLLSLLRQRLVDQVIYQSRFVQTWWEREHGPTPVPSHVIYNGVDLKTYSPHFPHQRPAEHWRVLLVEGSLMGGYEHGLAAAIELASRLAALINQPGELQVVGRVNPQSARFWEQRLAELTPNQPVMLTWSGLVSGQRIPEVDRSAHLLYSSDINPACPNSVIEALACGLPVVAFDTGALPELVTGDSGRIVPYGGNPWRLDPPDTSRLAQAAVEILSDQERFRLGARLRAETAFNLEAMVDAYVSVLLS